MNFEMFKEVVNNFGKSDDDMIQMHSWFHVQLDQKILDGLYYGSLSLVKWIFNKLVVCSVGPKPILILKLKPKFADIFEGYRNRCQNHIYKRESS